MHFLRLTIHGRVQGVGFRAFVEHEAARRKLEGWVRNRYDGAVEALIAGDQSALEQMIEACRRGPPAARVERIDIEKAVADELAQREAGERFSVLQTA